MTSATTFLPTKFSGPAPGAFHVDLNFAAKRIEADAMNKVAASISANERLRLSRIVISSASLYRGREQATLPSPGAGNRPAPTSRFNRGDQGSSIAAGSMGSARIAFLRGLNSQKSVKP